MLSDKKEKIKYLNNIVDELRDCLVKSIEIGADRNEDTQEELPLFEMINGGLAVLEVQYKIRTGYLTKEQGLVEISAHVQKKFGTPDTTTEEVFNSLPDDKKKLVN